jgi:hypothetical protein
MSVRATTRDIAAIALIRCVAEIVINPLGNFPLNDDWAWGRTVQTLLDTGDFRPNGWGPMSLLSHVLWGAVFCLPVGFSFTALRLAGFAASLVAGAGCYLLTLEASGTRALATVAALVCLFNPIAFALSATFMTDVPFVAIAVVAALFFARHLRTGRDDQLIVGTLCAAVAILSRQLAFVLPVSFAVALLAQRGLRAGAIVRAVVPVVACYAVLAGFEHWLIASGRLPALYRPLTVGFVHALFQSRAPSGDLMENLWLVMLYVGCMVLPLLLAIAPQMYETLRSRAIRAAAVTASSGLLVMSTYMLGQGRRLMPLSGNVVTAQGIGPMTLRDTYLLSLPNLAPLPTRLWEVVTGIAIVGGMLLAVGAVASAARIWNAVRRRQFNSVRAVGLFCAVCACGFLAPVFAEGFLDRYLIPSFPLLAAAMGALIVQPSSKPIAASTLTPPAILLALFALFSVAGTRDYLMWNRVRWELLDEVLTSHLATPRQIDGGFEFNGWHLYRPSYVATADKSWWWVDEDKYLVTFGTVPGWNVARQRTFSRWLPPGEGRILLVTR